MKNEKKAINVIRVSHIIVYILLGGIMTLKNAKGMFHYIGKGAGWEDCFLVEKIGLNWNEQRNCY